MKYNPSDNVRLFMIGKQVNTANKVYILVQSI